MAGPEEPEVVGVHVQHVGQRVLGPAEVVLSDALKSEVEPVRDGPGRASPLVEGLGPRREDDEATDRVERPVVVSSARSR